MKNKCSKTYSGKHQFIYQEKRNAGTAGPYYIEDKDSPKICKYCGIINL